MYFRTDFTVLQNLLIFGNQEISRIRDVYVSKHMSLVSLIMATLCRAEQNCFPNWGGGGRNIILLKGGGGSKAILDILLYEYNKYDLFRVKSFYTLLIS